MSTGAGLQQVHGSHTVTKPIIITSTITITTTKQADVDKWGLTAVQAADGGRDGPKLCDTLFGRRYDFFSLFIWLLLLIYNTVIFIGINKAYQQPMMANEGQCKPMQTNKSPHQLAQGGIRPTQANTGQCRPTKVNNSQWQPTKANAGHCRQQRPMKTHISQCMVTSGQHRPTKTDKSPQLPVANASQWRPWNPTAVSKIGPGIIPFYSFILLLICYILVFIWPMQANEDQCRLTKTNEGQCRPTKTNETPQLPAANASQWRP